MLSTGLVFVPYSEGTPSRRMEQKKRTLEFSEFHDRNSGRLSGNLKRNSWNSRAGNQNQSNFIQSSYGLYAVATSTN